MDIKIQELGNLLAELEIPLLRRDVSKLENVLWLDRNVAIRNQNHPNLLRIFELIRQLKKVL